MPDEKRKVIRVLTPEEAIKVKLLMKDREIASLRLESFLHFIGLKPNQHIFEFADGTNAIVWDEDKGQQEP